MDQSSSTDENAQEGTAMLSSATLPGQGAISQPAPKNDDDSVTSSGTNNGSDKPVDDVCDVAMLDQPGEALVHDNKNPVEDKTAIGIPNSGIEHNDVVNEQEGSTTSQLSSRTITPTPIPRDQESSRALVSPTINASEHPLGRQDDQPSGDEDRTFDYGTARRYPNKRAANYQPIQMDWAAPTSGNSGSTYQATGRVNVSPSEAHNPTFAIQGVLSQHITPQSSPHRKKNGKSKSKGKQSQQKMHEQSSNYVLPATSYQPQAADAAPSQQPPSQP